MSDRWESFFHRAIVNYHPADSSSGCKSFQRFPHFFHGVGPPSEAAFVIDHPPGSETQKSDRGIEFLVCFVSSHNVRHIAMRRVEVMQEKIEELGCWAGIVMIIVI